METTEKIELAQRITSEFIPRIESIRGLRVLRIGSIQSALGIGGQSHLISEVLEDPEFEFFSNGRCIGRVGPPGYTNTCYVFRIFG
jgi:hypothetical protein